MARLTLVDSKRQHRTNAPVHRASATEGDAVRLLLADQGYAAKKSGTGQLESACPFHEGPGDTPKKGAHFYVNANTGLYFCQSASCGERGNLQTLERHFGIGVEDGYTTALRTKEDQLREFESALTKDLRQPFYEAGLTDVTIERFRLGYDPIGEDIKDSNGNTVGSTGPRYVIPYLEGRRPRFFRYYNPVGDPKYKYTWESGAESTLYNAADAMGDERGIVFVCEGEKKAMLVTQLGYCAVAVPGASQWKDEWQAMFTHARQIYFLYDHDNPDFHNYDKEGNRCRKCAGAGLDRCAGHNPGQEAAERRVEQVGWRAKNVLLPLPSRDVRKVDINEFFMRDGNTTADFNQLVFGTRKSQYQVQTFAEISISPPEAPPMLVEQGILPKGGRLLIAGKPKVGKSIFVDNLALSLAAGIPFLKRFQVDHPTRTLLLDRELSKASLFKRLTDLTSDRLGYQAAAENLLIDHDHILRLDQPNATDLLMQLVEQNGAEVIILDTAYKFLSDVESSSGLMKAFAVLDKVIHDTGVSVVLTHHHKKGQASRGKENNDIADPDNVAGSFLWTGWPNGTILLNYLNRSVENPFNSICTFTAFRDAAPPEPLALYRDRESISYSAITEYSYSETSVETAPKPVSSAPDSEAVAELLLEMAPTTEENFLHVASAHFGVGLNLVRSFYLDVMSRGIFEKTSGKPAIIKLKGVDEGKSWEAEHGLPERPIPDTAGFTDVDMFDAAALA